MQEVRQGSAAAWCKPHYGLQSERPGCVTQLPAGLASATEPCCTIPAQSCLVAWPAAVHQVEVGVDPVVHAADGLAAAVALFAAGAAVDAFVAAAVVAAAGVPAAVVAAAVDAAAADAGKCFAVSAASVNTPAVHAAALYVAAVCAAAGYAAAVYAAAETVAASCQQPAAAAASGC